MNDVAKRYEKRKIFILRERTATFMKEKQDKYVSPLQRKRENGSETMWEEG